MIPLRDLCFLGSFEQKFFEQLTAYDLVWGFVNGSWKCTSLHVHYVPLYLWRKSRNIGSKHFEPEPGSTSQQSYFRIKVELLGHCCQTKRYWYNTSLSTRAYRLFCWNVYFWQIIFIRPSCWFLHHFTK